MTSSASDLDDVYSDAVADGSPMTLTDPAPAYTVSTAAVVTTAAVTQTVHTFGIQNRQTVRSGDGSAISEVAVVGVAAKSMAWPPQVGHTLTTTRGEVWLVTGVLPASHPDGTDLLYDLQVQRGAA